MEGARKPIQHSLYPTNCSETQAAKQEGASLQVTQPASGSEAGPGSSHPPYTAFPTNLNPKLEERRDSES